MPYKSDKQARFFKGCAHNRKGMKGKCPPEKVVREYEQAESQKRAIRGR